MLGGTAVPVDEATLHERISAAVGDRPESGQSYELQLERAFHKSRVEGRAVHVTWSAT
jgi:hypothetical protein